MTNILSYYSEQDKFKPPYPPLDPKIDYEELDFNKPYL
jgi:hypothetical protein